MDSKPAVAYVFNSRQGFARGKIVAFGRSATNSFFRKRLVGFEPTVSVAENNNVLQQAVGMLFQMTDEVVEPETLRCSAIELRRFVMERVAPVGLELTTPGV